MESRRARVLRKAKWLVSISRNCLIVLLCAIMAYYLVEVTEICHLTFDVQIAQPPKNPCCLALLFDSWSITNEVFSQQVSTLSRTFAILEAHSVSSILHQFQTKTEHAPIRLRLNQPESVSDHKRVHIFSSFQSKRSMSQISVAQLCIAREARWR